ncbi:sel1 repeat family protein [Pseudomonas gregormendelii]|uniref:Sel1 repeat family protein n=1 Tax=Pseudomonas gregormendelii TaxID=1628277 RepID=A0ABS3AQ15_9PSED|nr:tetratricopeptide repeat protein [Pseudomonas gregormendelii]MBN3968786.1 sel1 repeat family protein [Pseudomonas gregormendelii]
MSANIVGRTCSDRGRTMVVLDHVLPFISVQLNDDDIDLIVSADAGNADAQNDLAQLFDELGKREVALYWWGASADQGHPDAMHHLGNCFICGSGVCKDENTGIMWIAKAASLGHVVARGQINSLLRFANIGAR